MISTRDMVMVTALVSVALGAVAYAFSHVYQRSTTTPEVVMVLGVVLAFGCLLWLWADVLIRGVPL